MMWFPELFNRFNAYSQAHKGQEASVCEITEYVVKTGLESKDKLCSDKIESDVFMESLITVAAAFPSNILAVLFMDRLGRKFFLGKYNKFYKLKDNQLTGNIIPEVSTSLVPPKSASG